MNSQWEDAYSAFLCSVSDFSAAAGAQGTPSGTKLKAHKKRRQHIKDPAYTDKACHSLQDSQSDLQEVHSEASQLSTDAPSADAQQLQQQSSAATDPVQWRLARALISAASAAKCLGKLEEALDLLDRASDIDQTVERIHIRPLKREMKQQKRR